MIVGFLRVPRGAPVNARASGAPAVTVGQPDDEQPLAFMRRADFRRAEQTRRNVETQSFQIFANRIESECEMAGHIFEKHNSRLDFFNDSNN